MNRLFRYLAEKQQKLTSALLGGLFLLGGMVCPGVDDAKFSAYSLAIAGLFSSLIAGHAYLSARKQPELPPDMTPKE